LFHDGYVTPAYRQAGSNNEIIFPLSRRRERVGVRVAHLGFPLTLIVPLISRRSPLPLSRARRSWVIFWVNKRSALIRDFGTRSEICEKVQKLLINAFKRAKGGFPGLWFERLDRLL